MLSRRRLQACAAQAVLAPTLGAMGGTALAPSHHGITIRGIGRRWAGGVALTASASTHVPRTISSRCACRDASARLRQNSCPQGVQEVFVREACGVEEH